MTHTMKTSLFVCGFALTVMTLFLFAISSASGPTSNILTSKHRSILLHYDKETIHDKALLAGKFHGHQRVSLFYSVKGVGSMGEVSSGAIAIAENGSFSRTVSLPKHLKNGSALQLRLFTKAADGKIVDELSKQVIYQ